MSKTIGILGGMGPLATIDLYKKIVMNTPVQKDQDHLQIIIYNNPKIPSRMEALRPNGESPLPELIQSAVTLQNAGADFIVMPCHSAHYWIHEISSAIHIPFYNMIQTVIEYMDRYMVKKEGEKVLLLATETTIDSRMYQRSFHNNRIKLILPQRSTEQKNINKLILECKKGCMSNNKYLNDIGKIIERYELEGMNSIIGACTEIPLIFPFLKTSVELIDPTLLLAKKTIDIATKNL
ncbi:aspartate/glutamate racemase family protein [Chengkuizengella axinellae]|uniref:Amino acid racemase n=1 Tax=Chengkuizengella axinellae TaxID=3064388 RepID=A0ABT9IZD7_9BACL|nr:amino acid racemase [Chengkuizengella sp. 2205SS18-9]MDP5274573.1 amino acid racemase [Chengkuizengella sp. 2205SS18-9]